MTYNHPLSFVRLIILTFILACTPSTPSIAAQECVVLLHALGHTSLSMSSMSAYLKKANYLVVNRSYPTTKQPIAVLANHYLPAMIKVCQDHQSAKIHFVTHSIGGIVLRAYLQHHALPNLGRIVMLAPPNHGSPFADLLQHNLLFKFIVGPAGGELTTAPSSTPNTLAQVIHYPVGIIAGNYSFNPLAFLLFHEESDGKVGLSSTRLAGMKDFMILPFSHMFMPHHRVVVEQTAYFLKEGVFYKG